MTSWRARDNLRRVGVDPETVLELHRLGIDSDGTEHFHVEREHGVADLVLIERNGLRITAEDELDHVPLGDRSVREYVEQVATETGWQWTTDAPPAGGEPVP